MAIYVIQKHAAKHLHYDIRLESDGVLKSWALPKGPPTKEGEKRLAIPTEDHELSYARFEGVIPSGNYGAGTVMVWDIGTFKNITKDKIGRIMPVAQCIKNGRLKVVLEGKKLHGTYVFIKTTLAHKPSWLFFKMKGGQKHVIKNKSLSALSGRTIKINNHGITLSHENKIMFPDVHITKGNMIDYYHKIAPWMLPHVKNRYISMFRSPEGISGESFYQKDIPESFPSWICRALVPKLEDGHSCMAVANNAATLVYLANQCCITPHVSLSRIDKLKTPDRIHFDLDPSRDNDFSVVCNTALRLKEILESIGLVPFVMTTGSRGLHIVVPILRNSHFETVRDVAHTIANRVCALDPQHTTTEIRKNKRHGRVYVDVSRNAYGQTSVAPYALRAKPKAPVATPLQWEELLDKKLSPQRYTIKNIFKRLDLYGDPWKDINRYAQSLKKAQRKSH